jgi:ribonuclease HII
MLTPPRTVVRREGGLYALERALQRRGFRLVAGADEAGRGACAGPLVAAAAVLPEGKRGEIEGLADSKLLTAAARERIYAEVVKRALALDVLIVRAN